MGRRRGSCEAKEVDEARETEKRSVDHDSDEQADEAEAVKGFFSCYLLCSLSPRHKAHTYIGFTVNPRRRIKQHNGEMRCGALRTKRGRPWEMVLCIYGFPSNVSALQFEWAWQHPTESLAVRKAASSFKSLRGLANKIKLAYTMLTLPSWENLNLTVNLFSTKHTKHIAGCPRLPNQMRFNICAMDDLPCYAEGRVLLCRHDDFDEDDGEEEIIKDVNLLASVDVTIKGLNRNIDQMGNSSSLSPNSCTDDGGMEQVRQKSTPRGSDNERMTDDLLLSPEAGVINLCTPSSGIIRSKTKRALFDSAIIDLTDSPTVIQV